MVISTSPVSCEEILGRFPNLFIKSEGRLDTKVRAVAAPEAASPDSIVFLGTPKSLAAGLKCEAAVLVVPPKHFEETKSTSQGRHVILVSPQVDLAMASVISAFFLQTPYTNRSVTSVHPTAYVSPEAVLAAGVRIGPNAFVGAHVRLGPGVYIGATSVIEDMTEIGEGSVIHPQVFIGHSTVIGKNCEVHPQAVVAKEGYGYAHDEKGNHYRIPHQGRVVIEDDVHIGGCCSIDRATFGETRIERGAKLDNQIHIAHNCRIGRNALLTGGFTIAGSSRIGANFVAGGRTVVSGHLEVCDNVQVAGLSAIRKSVTVPGQYGGNPLQPLQQSIRTNVALSHLSEIQKQMKLIMKKLGLNASESDPDQPVNK